ncbi:MAG: alpha/beta hydrolase, partial [Betaproteobacteria bacterium]
RPEDDPFATIEAATRVQSHFPNTYFWDHVLHVPAGGRAIGHFGFFHPSNRERAWTIAREWLLSEG